MIRLTMSLFIIALCSWLNCSGDRASQIYTGIVEGTAVQVPALTGGQIRALFVDTGQEVPAGLTLAVIDTQELSYQRQNLTGIFREMQVQRKISQTSIERAGKEFQYIREKYERFESLLQNQSVPQQTVDDLANQLQNAASAYQTAQQQLMTIEARLTQIQAQLNSVSKKISDALITSPRNGIITEKYYEAGEAIPPLAPLVEIIHLDEVWVKIYISEKMLPHIKPGQEVNITADGTERSLTGRISWINSKAEFTPKTILTPETRTSLVFAVKILIANPDHLLKHGMPIEVHL